MSTLKIWESVQSVDGDPLIRLDSKVTTNSVTFTGTAGQSAAFDDDTGVISVLADADCAVAIGSNPTATTADFPVPANCRCDFRVAPGQKISAIANPGASGGATSTGALTNAGAGIVATASFTPAAAAYSANAVMGTTPVQQFAFTYAGSGLAIPSTSLIRILTAIVRIDQTALQASEGAYQLQGYNVTPPSAQADQAAWSLASADLAAYRGAIALGTPVDLGAACYVKSPNIDLDIRLTTGVLFAELQTLAGFTATAVARQVTLYGIIL